MAWPVLVGVFPDTAPPDAPPPAAGPASAGVSASEATGPVVSWVDSAGAEFGRGLGGKSRLLSSAKTESSGAEK